MKGTDSDLDKNIFEIREMAKKELDFEEKRFETLSKKALVYIGMIPIVFLLLLNVGLQIQLTGELLNVLYGGILFLILSIILAFVAFTVQPFKRPNIYNKDGIQQENMMNQTHKKFNEYLIKHIMQIVNENQKRNNKNAKFLLCSTYAFFIGFFIIIFTILGGLL